MQHVFNVFMYPICTDYFINLNLENNEHLPIVIFFIVAII